MAITTLGGTRKRQHGFSLVEVAIVLVIIGLLLGATLKGQEMMNSAKVRGLADMTNAAQAAYFGFVDRFHKVPGDWDAASATIGIGVAITGGGNNNSRIDNPAGPALYNEANAFWEQLSKGGFITGAYDGTPGVEPTVDNNLAPTNPFSGVVTIGRTPDYLGVNPPALQVSTGRFVPVGIMRELDVKIDDGSPDTGQLRSTVAAPTVFSGVNSWGGSDPSCVTAVAPLAWNIASDATDCNAVVRY